MRNNIMDTVTQKEKEESMGLSDGQKAELSASGLTRDEIKLIHEARLAQSIKEERARLDKMERKLSDSRLGSTLSALLEDEKGNRKIEDEGSGDDADLEPIFTNAEANKIISMEARKIEGFQEADAEFIDAALDTEAEDYEKIGGRLNKAAIKVVNMISPIVDKVQKRRWKGYEIAYREWVERGEKEGAEPDPWSGVYNLPILLYYNYLYH